MKKLVCFSLILWLTVGLCACGGNGAAVSLNGSTSMEQVIGTLAEQFTSDTGLAVTYDATGSGTGIETVKTGACDIGLSSRNLKDSEAGLQATVIALDGIAVIVNAENPLTDLTAEQLAAIFTGSVQNWSALDGADMEIACIGREAGSGTRDGFETATGTSGACVLAQELTSTGAVIEAVRGSKNAIGYASLSAVEGKTGVTVLRVGGVACSEQTVKDGSYALQRPFALITKQDAALSDSAQAFFDYATSAAAADLIRRAGAVPVA